MLRNPFSVALLAFSVLVWGAVIFAILRGIIR